jgi:hypothetical protein
MSARGPAISLIKLRSLHSQGMTDRQIADALRCSKSWAAAQRKKMGLPLNLTGYRRHIKLDRNRIIELHTSWKDDDEIAKEMECSFWTIKTIRLKLGLRNRIYKTRHLIEEGENHVTVNYFEKIKQFRGLDVTDPTVHEAIEAHNRSIELAEKGWRERT